jgi:hypothetical protein
MSGDDLKGDAGWEALDDQLSDEDAHAILGGQRSPIGGPACNARHPNRFQVRFTNKWDSCT